MPVIVNGYASRPKLAQAAKVSPSKKKSKVYKKLIYAKIHLSQARHNICCTINTMKGIDEYIDKDLLAEFKEDMDSLDRS